MYIFSSPELKSLSELFRSHVVRLSVNFYNFDFSILTKLGTNHSWEEGIQVFFSIDGIAPLQEDIKVKE
jgi:hypothetical protein